MIQAPRHLEDHKPRPGHSHQQLRLGSKHSAARHCGLDARLADAGVTRVTLPWEGMWRAEAGMDETPHYNRRVAIVFVDDFEVHTVAALRYARSLHPTTLRAVHVVIDSQQAQQLRAAWLPDRGVPLELVDCPGRRLTRCAAGLVRREAEQPGAQVTVILPGRSFSPLLGRLLHGRTADKIAGAVSRVPNVAVTIIPSSAASEQSRPVALRG